MGRSPQYLLAVSVRAAVGQRLLANRRDSGAIRVDDFIRIGADPLLEQGRGSDLGPVAATPINNFWLDDKSASVSCSRSCGQAAPPAAPTTSDQPLARIGFASGYVEQTRLRRDFRQCIALTPLEYRAAFAARNLNSGHERLPWLGTGTAHLAGGHASIDQLV